MVGVAARAIVDGVAVEGVMGAVGVGAVATRKGLEIEVAAKRRCRRCSHRIAPPGMRAHR